MIKILKKWGYSIGNEKGCTNIKSNIADIALALLYLFLSVKNVRSKTPSELVFYINMITLGRLIIKNYLEQSKLVRKMSPGDGYTPMGITAVHFVKILLGGATLFFLFLFFFLNKHLSLAVEGVVVVGVCCVLVMTFLENILSAIERMYEAQPIPLLKYEGAK